MLKFKIICINNLAMYKFISIFAIAKLRYETGKFTYFKYSMLVFSESSA